MDMVVLSGNEKIEGDFKTTTTPVAGRNFMFTLPNVGVSTDLRATTDEQGKFKLDKVPAGEGQIVRLVSIGPNSWMHSHNTSVTVQPGQTTVVTLGDSGAVIQGRASLETPPNDGEKINISGRLSTS